MAQDDTGKRIADLEERRFVASPAPDVKRIYTFLLGAVATLFALVGVCAALVYVFPAMLTTAWVAVFPVLLVVWFGAVSYVALRRMPRTIVVRVTSHGLIVDQRPGDVFSFSDAQLGLWSHGTDVGSTTVGTALHLRGGPQRFVLGGQDHHAAPGTRLDAPPAHTVDAVIGASHFDELLALIGRGSEAPHATRSDANAAWGTVSGAPKPARVGVWTWIGVSLFALYCLGGGLYFIRGGVLSWYEYRVGTPTTATIDHCASYASRSGGYQVCDGRWTVGGVSQAGPIQFRFDERVGSQVDVHVRGGHAYTAYDVHPVYLEIFAGFFAFAWGFGALWSVWRKHKTGRWPLSGRRFKLFGQPGPPNRT